jgi:GGDEF domain-containing protein
MILDADHAVLRLQDPRTRRYRVASYFGSADDALQPRLFELDKRVSIEAIRRRAPFSVRDLASDSKFSAWAGEFTSLISAPLAVGGEVVGTVSIYDKVAIDRFFVGRFDDEDLHVFAKFVSYVERSVANARAHSEARALGHFDAETGLPNARYFAARVHEEITRAGDRERALALMTCSIVNSPANGNPLRPHTAHRARAATVEALASVLRDFDVLARVDDACFAVLLPEPGLEPAERAAEVARRTAERVRRDDALNDPVPVELAFGYAVHPGDGADPDALLARAREPRIRML